MAGKRAGDAYTHLAKGLSHGQKINAHTAISVNVCPLGIIEFKGKKWTYIMNEWAVEMRKMHKGLP